MSTQVIDRMAVEVDGQGDARHLHPRPRRHLQCLHAAVSWRSASRYRIVRPDLPGSGALAGERRAVDRGSSPMRSRAWRARSASSAPISSAIRSGTHRLPAHRRCRSRSWCGAWRCSGRCWRRRMPARQGLRDRAEKARAEGMAAIAEADRPGGDRHRHPANKPVAVALVRELLMRQDAEGYARSCEALAGAEAADVGADRLPGPAGDRRRGRRSRRRRARGPWPSASRRARRDLPRCGHWATFERRGGVQRGAEGVSMPATCRSAATQLQSQ